MCLFCSLEVGTGDCMKWVYVSFWRRFCQRQHQQPTTTFVYRQSPSGRQRHIWGVHIYHWWLHPRCAWGQHNEETTKPRKKDPNKRKRSRIQHGSRAIASHNMTIGQRHRFSFRLNQTSGQQYQNQESATGQLQ